jgi:hypothetical protein
MHRHSGRFVRPAFITLALCLIAGCTAHTDIETNKDASYTREPQRLMVIEAMGSPLGGYTKSFQDKIRENIHACNIFTNYVITPAEMSNPNLSMDEAPVKKWLADRDAFIARFRPDTILAIAETQYLQQTLSRNGVPISTTIPQVTYELTVTDLVTKKNVWKAQVMLHTGTIGGVDPGALLANDITARLSQDGIFQHCEPITAAPQPSPAGVSPDGRP